MERIKDVTFMSNKLKEEYESLQEGKFEDKELFKYITRAIEDLKQAPFRNPRIPEDLIPQKYIQEYEIKSLWKYDLPDGWRLMYTITGNEVRIVSVILEW